MRLPEALVPLLDYGIIDEVLRPLMSGKEAQIYLVLAEGEERVAKVYKGAQNRTFKHRATYTEGRAVRNSRDRRAMAKRSRHGKALDEEGWRAAEVDIIYRLQAAGVRVPEPYNYVDGVLVMELVTDGRGQPAPRLADVHLSRDEGCSIFRKLLDEIVKMLHGGIVHGDLSEFNVLLAEDGPVVIDFPQAVEAARNQSARRLLIRDVDNLGRYLCRSRRGRPPRYGQEMWRAFERGELTPGMHLTGLLPQESKKKADTEGVLAEIEDVAREAERRSEGSTTSRRRRRRRRGARQGEAPATAAKGPEVIVVHKGRRNAILPSSLALGGAIGSSSPPRSRDDERSARTKPTTSSLPSSGVKPSGGRGPDEGTKPRASSRRRQRRRPKTTTPPK